MLTAAGLRAARGGARTTRSPRAGARALLAPHRSTTLGSWPPLVARHNATAARVFVAWRDTAAARVLVARRDASPAVGRVAAGVIGQWSPARSSHLSSLNPSRKCNKGLAQPPWYAIIGTNLLSQLDSNTKSEAHASEVSTVRFPCRARIFEILKSRKMAIVYVRLSRGWMCG